MSAEEIITTAVKNQPKQKKFLGSCLRGCLVTFLILALPVWWFCFHTTPLRISPETTYVLGPMTSDGKRIDYFRAMEERYYPPEMKTDDNGYRMIVRAFGANVDSEPLRIQVYEKLGLDPNIKPSMNPIESPLGSGDYSFYKYDKEHPRAEGGQTQSEKFQRQSYWTFDDFPMLEEWYNEHTAGLDLLGESIRKPAFRIPYTRENENTPTFLSLFRLDDVQWFRECARAAQVRAQYRLGIGDIDGAIDDIMTIHHLARHAGKQGTLMLWLVGIALEGMGNAIGIGSNPAFPPTKWQIERLIAEIDALPSRWTYRDAIESERYFGLAALQDMYWGITPVFSEDGDPFPYFRFLFPAMRWTFDINVAMARLNKIHDAMAKITVDDKTAEKFSAPLSTGNPYNPLPLLFVRSRTNRIMDTLKLLMNPAVLAYYEAERRLECTANLQRLTLALLLYEKDHGNLPEGDWREAIKPYLGENWERYFRCPSHRLAQGETNYAMIGTVPNLSPSPNQILLVEVSQLQKLGEGDGRIPYEQAKLMKAGSVGDSRSDRSDGLGSPHPGVINIGFRSGAARGISITTKPEVLQSLLDGTATALP